MTGKNFLVVIPARFMSMRLPGKIIADIHGKPMIVWVAERVLSTSIAPILVATDSQNVLDICNTYNIPSVLTNKSCLNGTERVYEVSQMYPDVQYFINVQGDEPLLNTQILHDMINTGFDDDVFKTAVSRIETTVENNSSEVKVALSFGNRIRYASRSQIPFCRDGSMDMYKIHGVYMYSRDVLKRFIDAPIGPLERAESVEQLRCIESDIPLIGVISHDSERSVDTQQDLDYIRQLDKERFLL